MKKYMLFAALSLFAIAQASEPNLPNEAYKIPHILPVSCWEKIPDVAQYKKADWSNVVGQVSNVSVSEAQRIAEQNPNISYFFYVNAYQLVLENDDYSPPTYRVFHHGDAVFFSGTPHWGEARGFADGYVRCN